MATYVINGKIKDAIGGAVSVMLAGASVPQERAASAVHALFAVLEGEGVATLTDARPIGRIVKRKVACQLLGVSRTTLHRMVRRGTLRAVRCGITEQSLRELMNGKEVR